MNIDPQKYYSPFSLYKENVFPWIRSYSMMKKFVRKDMSNFNRLKALKSGQGHGARYLIRGENILNLLQEAEKGLILYD